MAVTSVRFGKHRHSPSADQTFDFTDRFTGGRNFTFGFCGGGIDSFTNASILRSWKFRMGEECHGGVEGRTRNNHTTHV